MKEKKWRSLTSKLNILILAIVFALSAGLTVIAYEVNSSRVDKYYKQTTSYEASAVAAFMDGDWLGDFLGIIMSDEYQALREEAIAAGDESLVVSWLEEHGLYEKYMEICDDLLVYRERMGALYIYIQAAHANARAAVNVIDPDEGILYTGSVTPSAEEFGQVTDNRRIEPTVSTTEYGTLCTAIEPITASDGRAVAQVGVDIDMTDVMAERHQFLLQMLGFALVLAAASITLSILLMRKMATKPLAMLAKATYGFADSKTGYTEEDIISLPIHSRDEIGDLYAEIRSMQSRMVEYLQNLTRVTAEKERIGAELSIATQIQADMLPRIFPAFPERPELDLYASMSPAKEVGGDFYDFFLIDDDHIGLVMADVSGKGVPAALFMVIAKTLIKNRAQLGESPATILRNVNDQLCEGNDAELFVTVWLAVIELSTGKGMAANAGHEHPVIRRADGKYELVVYRHSPAVATMEGIRFREHEFQLNPGDSLFVYTDGVPEATDANNELYGPDRMLEALNRDPDVSPKQLLSNVRQDIDAFVGNAPQFDDITMMCFRYIGHPGRTRELTLDATDENLDDVLAFVDEELARMDCPPKVQMQIDVAVEEMFVNIAHYAYAPGTGSATLRMTTALAPRSAEITLVDSGMAYNPLDKPDPDVTLPAEERPIGGLGIYMVKKSMDEVHYEYRDGQNVFTLKKLF